MEPHTKPNDHDSGAGTARSASNKEGLLDLSLYKDIRVDESSNGRLVICQAMVTMEDLVAFTLERRRIPKVVAKFRHITVSEAISGCELKSSSHLYGQFMDTVAWVKVRLGDGTEKIARRNDVLWCSISGTLGSIGIVLEAAIECVVASPYVQVSYYCYSDTGKAVKRLQSVSKSKEHVFLEAIEMPPAQLVDTKKCFVAAVNMALGKPVDEEPEKSVTPMTVVMQGQMAGEFGEPKYSAGWSVKRFGGPFYYEHVRNLASDHLKGATEPYVDDQEGDEPMPFFMESIAIEDYLFRYDDGAFWMARPLAFDWRRLSDYLPFLLFMIILSWQIFRFVTGFMFTARRLYQLQSFLDAPAVIASRMVVQDLYLPADDAVALVEDVRGYGGSPRIPVSTPIWICPVRANVNQPFTPSYRKGSVDVKTLVTGTNGNNDDLPPSVSSTEVLVNVGIYGRVADDRGREYIKWLEENYCGSVGRKMLSTTNCFSRDKFWNVLDRALYEQLRKQFHANGALPDLYDRACPPVPKPSNSSGDRIAMALI